MNKELLSFQGYLRLERGLCQNTLLAYEKDLMELSEYCRRKSKPICGLGASDLRNFFSGQRRRGLSTRSIARQLSTIKHLYRFLVRENRVSEDPAELLSITLRARKLPQILSLEEVARLIDSVDGESMEKIRDRAILELWYGTGSRISELIGLTVEAIDLKEAVVRFRGKGDRERLVPLNRRAIEWCQKYRQIRHRSRLGLKSDKFFLTRMGEGFSRVGMWKLFKKYVAQAGFTRRVWPHVIRHSFATHLLNGGADLRVVQELLGHRSISTTQIYTHLDIENLKLMQIKYHPRS